MSCICDLVENTGIYIFLWGSTFFSHRMGILFYKIDLELRMHIKSSCFYRMKDFILVLSCSMNLLSVIIHLLFTGHVFFLILLLGMFGLCLYI